MIKREISGRMICMYIGTLFVLRPVSGNIPFHAHAIIIFIRIVDKINIDLISTHISFDAKFYTEFEFKIKIFISAYARYLSYVTQFHAIGSRIFLFDRACSCLFGVRISRNFSKSTFSDVSVSRSQSWFCANPC